MEDMEQLRSFEFRTPNPSLTIPEGEKFESNIPETEAENMSVATGQVEGIYNGDKPDANLTMVGGIPDQHLQMAEAECKIWVATFLKSR